MTIARRRTRSGYVLVLLSLAVMGIMASQASTEDTAQMYEMQQVNQRLIDRQMRWFGEGLLEYTRASADAANDASKQYTPLISAAWPGQWFNKGQIATRASTTRFNASVSSIGEITTDYYEKRLTFTWVNVVGGAPVTGATRLSRRWMKWDTGSTEWTDIGFFQFR